RLAKYGYDSIEISYDSVELNPGAPGSQAVRGMLKENGVKCYGSISLMFAGRDLIHADSAVRASSVDYLKRCVTMVKELDGRVMSIVPSEVGNCLDVYHMNQEDANMFKAIRNAGSKMYDLHVADNNRMACGQGALDWERLINTCKEIGYDGSLTVEFVPPIDRTPANPYKNALAAADATLTPEQLKFIEDHGSGVLSEEFYSWLVEESIKTLRKYM